MTQFLFKIADDKQPHVEVIAHADDVAIDLGEERKLQHDDLRDSARDDNLFQIVGIVQNRYAVFRLFNLEAEAWAAKQDWERAWRAWEMFQTAKNGEQPRPLIAPTSSETPVR